MTKSSLLKNDPILWAEIYDSCVTYSPTYFGLSSIKDVQIIPAPVPKQVKSLSSIIEQFWDGMKKINQKLRNDAKYVLTGLSDIDVKNTTLIVKAYQADYATVLFKNSRTQPYNQQLSVEKQQFLDTQFFTVGVEGYVTTDNQQVLFGTRADRGPRAGLHETIPRGLVDYQVDSKNLLIDSLARELQEETNLDFYKDMSTSQPIHIMLGSKFGDCTIVNHMVCKTASIPKAKANPAEHTNLFWLNAQTPKIYREIMDNRIQYNPATIITLEEFYKASKIRV